MSVNRINRPISTLFLQNVSDCCFLHGVRLGKKYYFCEKLYTDYGVFQGGSLSGFSVNVLPVS